MSSPRSSALVTRREESADITRRHCAEQRVGNRVQQYVAVAVACQPFRMSMAMPPMRSGTPAWKAWESQPWPNANIHESLTSASRRGASAPGLATRFGVEPGRTRLARDRRLRDLRFAGEPGTTATWQPARSTRLASSVPAKPSASASAKARFRIDQRKPWGVCACTTYSRGMVVRIMAPCAVRSTCLMVVDGRQTDDGGAMLSYGFDGGRAMVSESMRGRTASCTRTMSSSSACTTASARPTDS